MSIAASAEAHAALLVEALNGLEAMAEAQPKNLTVGLVLDEF